MLEIRLGSCFGELDTFGTRLLIDDRRWSTGPHTRRTAARAISLADELKTHLSINPPLVTDDIPFSIRLRFLPARNLVSRAVLLIFKLFTFWSHFSRSRFIWTFSRHLLLPFPAPKKKQKPEIIMKTNKSFGRHQHHKARSYSGDKLDYGNLGAKRVNLSANWFFYLAEAHSGATSPLQRWNFLAADRGQSDLRLLQWLPIFLFRSIILCSGISKWQFSIGIQHYLWNFCLLIKKMKLNVFWWGKTSQIIF